MLHENIYTQFPDINYNIVKALILIKDVGTKSYTIDVDMSHIKKKSFKFQWLLFFKKDPMKNYPKTLVIFSRNEIGVYVNNYKEGDEVTLPPPTPVYIDTW